MNNVKVIAIIGMGLMGASLAAALRDKSYSGSIVGWSRSKETKDKAEKSKWFDKVFNSASEAVADADLVIFCLPVKSIPKLVEKLSLSFKSNAIITDVGSTKFELINMVEGLLDKSSSTFIGSHPICGSEKSGFEGADPNLYNESITVVCPSNNNEAYCVVKDLWKFIGSEVVELESNTHDELLASTSHLPHLVSALLVRTSLSYPNAINFCGTGFRDTTRLASGSSLVWADILDSNRESIKEVLQKYKYELINLINLLDTGSYNDLQEWLEDSRTMRERVKVSGKLIDE